MKLLVPLGLLGLIAIAFLILIYVLKPKYQDKKVSSTYIWKLSLKYAKRKVPFTWLQNSLLFIIQLLIIIVIAFSMAMPHIILATKNGEKIIVLDASASMAAEYNGKTRFDRARNEISGIIDTTDEAQKITVILAGESASYVIRRTDSAGYAKQKLSEAECSFANADIEGAMKLAESVLSENPKAEVYFFTDSDYTDSGNVNVVNVSATEWNAAVLSFSAKWGSKGYTFFADVACYGKAAELPVSIVVDGKAQLPRLADCSDGETVRIVWDDLNVKSYESAEVHIAAEDNFAYDNDFYLYTDTNEMFEVQLVGNEMNTSFISSALRVTGKCHIVSVNLADDGENAENGENAVTEKSSGFDLYVYDNYVPEVIPTDGAVWFINPPQSLPDLGITINGTRTDMENPFYMSQGSADSEAARAILKYLTPSSIKVTEYSRIEATGYESVLKLNDDPALLIRNVNGLKTVVFSFGLNYSDLPILVPQFVLLVDALCDYSMAHTFDKTLYSVGDTVKLNARLDAEYMSVDAVGEEETFSSSVVNLKADKAGVYKVTQSTYSGRTISSSFFVRLSENESVFGKTEGALVNPLTPYGSGTDTTVANNTMDISVYLAAALLVLLCVEWGLQYREQY